MFLEKYGGIHMNVKFDRVKDKLIAHMSGELDHHSAEEVRYLIDSRIDCENINKLIIDFSGVTFMDSSGIGVVIGRYKKLKMKNGIVCVSNVKDSISRVFELSGMYKIIKLYDTFENAAKYL